MKIAFTTLGCPSWDLDTIIARAVEYGYDGVDFRGLGGEMDIYKLPEFTSTRQETRSKFADAGLEICGFATGVAAVETDPAKIAEATEQIAQYAELCKFFGVEFIRVFGRHVEGVGVDEAATIGARNLDTFAEIVAPATIVIETHDRWCNTANLAKMLSRVTAPNVGALWDLHHPYRICSEDPETSYRNIGKSVLYAHVKDGSITKDGEWTYTLPGEGDVPLEQMISLLAEGGYDGYLTVEWEKFWIAELAEPEIALPAYANYLRTLIT